MPELTAEQQEQQRVMAIDRAMLELQLFRDYPHKYKAADIEFSNELYSAGMTISLKWDKKPIRIELATMGEG